MEEKMKYTNLQTDQIETLELTSRLIFKTPEEFFAAAITICIDNKIPKERLKEIVESFRILGIIGKES